LPLGFGLRNLRMTLGRQFALRKAAKENNLKSYSTGRQLGRRNTVVHVFITEAGAIQVASLQ